jgi:glutaredoxin-like protein
MGLINEGIKAKLKSIFSQLKDDVTLKVFTQEIECPTCKDNTNFMQEISELSYKIKIDILNFVLNKDEAEKLKIDKIPATAVLGDKDYGIRFFGIPAGYEFNSFINAIKMVSLKDSGLREDIKQKVKTINKPVNIKVFVTLTCPYCPMAVEVGHKFAFENDNIISEMIDASEFPHLANRYGVYAVPKVVINDKISFEGAVPEDLFLNYILEAIK